MDIERVYSILSCWFSPPKYTNTGNQSIVTNGRAYMSLKFGLLYFYRDLYLIFWAHIILVFLSRITWNKWTRTHILYMYIWPS